MDEGVVMTALKALADIGQTRETAADLVPNAPGLYAFHGDDAAWSDLGLSPDFDGQPLYVGKAERSLKSRDVETHFAAGRTGASTLRRSLAALLVGKLCLVAIPRNTARPERTASFGLDDESERRLSGWMDQRMTLSTWTRSEGVVLDDIETSVLSHLRPPLNLTKVGEPRTRLRMLRQGMADAARAWTADASPTDPARDLVPLQGRTLVGDDPFSGLDATVADFWRFAMSDLRTNNIRGYLAEFFVARAVGSLRPRVEWDAWDVTALDGTRIEVKSAGYLQSWVQKKLSTPTFRVAPAYRWAPDNTWSQDQQFNADVYVFCLHTAQTHEEYDPLALSQWSFYVADRCAVEGRAGASMGLATLARIAGEPVPFSGLQHAIELAAERSRTAGTGSPKTN